MKNPFRKLSREAQGGLIISTVALVFFSSVATIGLLASNRHSSGDVNINSLPVSVVGPSSSLPPSSEDPVDSKQDVIAKPTTAEVSIVRYFFDIAYDSDDPRLAKALYKVDNTTHQSRGLDYALEDDQPFEVTAALDGKVKSITPDDRLFGTILAVESKTGLIFVYAGIKDIAVKVGEEVKKNQILARSGISSLNGEYKNALHFEILKDEVPLNPEKCLGEKESQL